MPSFIVRVELPNKPHGDYAQLHRDMYHARYYTVIKADGGALWHLPHATYDATGENWTMQMIREEVLAIARRSHAEPRVFVAEYARACWEGLRPVTSADPAPSY